jgi:hypothetical protein
MELRSAFCRIETLRRHLSDGTWDARYGRFRTQPEFDGPLRLIVGEMERVGGGTD